MYGVSPVRLLAPENGYRNTSYPVLCHDGSMVNIIIYKCEDGILQRIQRANAVSGYLAECGLAVRTPLGPILRVRAGTVERFAVLYNYLPGKTIPWEAYTQDHIKLLGEAMGAMHGFLREMSGSKTDQLSDVVAESQELLARIEVYFADPGIRDAMASKLHLQIPMPGGKLGEYRRLLEYCAPLSERQALHMDFVRGNILFAQPVAVSGILDFEKTAYGPAVFDISRTLAFLLVDCRYKQPDRVHKYFLESGYKKRGGGRVAAEQRQLIGPLTRFFMLHDFYKFLRHNPYQDLDINEHFTRTRDFLVDYGTINPTK